MEKNDVFVGNVTFNTTVEQLNDIFSFVGPVKNIRILTDKDTGRPKGFAFVEYVDANTALAAIRRLDGTELNGRKLRVSYSNNSNLRDLAKSIGQEVIESEPTLRQETQAILNLQLHEAWDILDCVKKIADEDNGEKVRVLLENYPQLIPALLQIQKRLGIVAPVISKSKSAEGSKSAATATTTSAVLEDDPPPAKIPRININTGTSDSSTTITTTTTTTMRNPSQDYYDNNIGGRLDDSTSYVSNVNDTHPDSNAIKNDTYYDTRGSTIDGGGYYDSRDPQKNTQGYTDNYNTQRGGRNMTSQDAASNQYYSPSNSNNNSRNRRTFNDMDGYNQDTYTNNMNTNYNNNNRINDNYNNTPYDMNNTYNNNYDNNNDSYYNNTNMSNNNAYMNRQGNYRDDDRYYNNNTTNDMNDNYNNMNSGYSNNTNNTGNQGYNQYNNYDRNTDINTINTVTNTNNSGSGTTGGGSGYRSSLFQNYNDRY